MRPDPDRMARDRLDRAPELGLAHTPEQILVERGADQSLVDHRNRSGVECPLPPTVRTLPLK